MKYIILISGIFFCLIRIIQGIKANREQRQRVEAEKQREADAIRLRQEWRESQAQIKLAQMEARTAILKQEAMYKEQERQRKEQERLNREQERQAREQERQAKEQERQAVQLARHEEQLLKLDNRLASAESEISYNRELIERLFKVQEMEIEQRDACSYGSPEWQKCELKVISREKQIHTLQKRIDKAKADKRFCASKLA